MNQFMGMDFSNEAPGAAVAAASLAVQISKAQRQGDALGKGIALQEFIAWSLTNQALGESLRTSKVRTPLMKLVFKSMQALRRMLGLPTGQMLDMFSNISYNTGALIQMTSQDRMTTEQRFNAVPVGRDLNQVSPNTDTRLDQLMQKFENSIAVHLRGMKPLGRAVEELDIRQIADRALRCASAR